MAKWIIIGGLMCAALGSAVGGTGSGVSAHAAQARRTLTANTAYSGHFSAGHSVDTQQSFAMPAWIVRATPFVHVTNHIALIDPAITNYLSSQDLVQVERAVAYYNASQRMSHVGRTPSTPQATGYVITGSGGCTFWAYETDHWWGRTLQVNGCLAAYLGHTVLTSPGAAAVLAGACGLAGQPECAGAAIIFGGLAIIYGQWILNDNGLCNNEGAFIDETWDFSHTWIDKVC